MNKVFFGPSFGIWKKLYNDVVESDECEYCYYDEDKHSRSDEICISSKLQDALPHFVRRVIYRNIFQYDFLRSDKNAEYLFVFSNAYSLFGSDRLFSFISFLKKEYLYSKFAIHYMESLNHCYPEQIDLVKNSFDLVLSFDHYDTERYSVEHYPPVCEKNTIKPEGKIEFSDVFYVGGTSDPRFGRVDFCTKTFKYLSDNNIKCIFFLDGVLPEKQIEIASKLGAKLISENNEHIIFYHDSKIVFGYLTYVHALQYIYHTRAMLEIVPRGRVSCTCRLAQAMVAQKKLITTSPTIELEAFYRPENMLSFEKPEDIDLAFFNKPFVPVDFDFSTLGLIDYCKDRLFD